MNTAFVFILIIGLTLIVTFFVGIRDRKREEQKRIRDLESRFGKRGFKEMPEGRYEELGGYLERHKRAFTLDDITWRDLDLDSLYREIDTTCSSAGEEYLYYLLRSPSLRREELLLKEDQIRFWSTESGHRDLRLKVQRTLQKYGQTGKYSIYLYLNLLTDLPNRSPAADLPAVILPVAAFLLMFWNRPLGTVLLIGVLVLNMLTYFRDKGRIRPYLDAMRAVLRLLACGEKLDVLLGEASSVFAAERKAFGESKSDFSTFRRGSALLLRERGVTGNPLDLLFDYVCILLHLDLFQFGKMLNNLKGKDLSLDALITSIGRVDASIAAASYRECLPAWCVPDFTKKEETVFEAAGLYHPLLEEPVPNDFRTDRPVLLTGSNASGKSTFLKAAALSAVMAQSLHTVPAKEYHSPCFRIMTSMALRDSILDGESYFIVEIRSLRRIIDASEEKSADLDAPILCCIDEVLRGTNTVERISASTEILRTLAGENILVFAATHDLELTDLLEEFYENYHFEEEIQGEDVTFSYRILPGKALTRNAIRLLRVMGYDETLADKAEKRAQAFLKTGVWEK